MFLESRRIKLLPVHREHHEPVKLSARHAVEESIAAVRNAFDLGGYAVEIHYITPTERTFKTEAMMRSTRIKEKVLKAVGLQTKVVAHPPFSSSDDFSMSLRMAGNDKKVVAILVQLPVPDYLENTLRELDDRKDIDGVKPNNSIWKSCIASEAAAGLLASSGIVFNKIAVVGAKGFVGSRVIKEIERAGLGPVQQIDDKDQIIFDRRVDGVVSAVGSPHLINVANFMGNVKIVVDVGNSPTPKGIIGDVNSFFLGSRVEYLTTVPGGAGPGSIPVMLRRITENIAGPGKGLGFQYQL